MSSDGTALDAIRPRDFLALIGYNAASRKWLYIAIIVPQVITLLAAVYYFHRQKHRVARTLSGSGATLRSRPLGAKRLVVATFISLLLMVPATYFYNSYHSLQQGQDLSEQCETVLFAYVNLSAQDGANSAMLNWRAISRRMQQAIELSDYERELGLLPMGNLKNDTRERTLLVEHLRQYGEAYQDVVSLELELGFLSHDVFFGVKMSRHEGAVLLCDAPPWSTSTGLMNASLVQYELGSNVHDAVADRGPVSADLFFQIFQKVSRGDRRRRDPDRAASAIRFTLPDGSMANVIYTTKLAYNAEGEVQGLWFAAMDIHHLYPLMWTSTVSALFNGLYLSVLMNSDMKVVLLSPPLWQPNGTTVTLEDVPDPLFQALGKHLQVQGLGSQFDWEDPSGGQWRIVSVGDGNGYYYLLGLSFTSMEAYYNPQPFFEDLLHWSKLLDFIAVAVFAYCLVSGAFFYVCWLMLRPKNALERVSQVMVVSASACFLASLVTIDTILSQKLNRWTVNAFDSQCSAAVRTQTALRLAFTTLVTVQEAVWSLRSLPLIANLTARSVAIEKFQATDLDSSPSQQTALRNYQWALLEAFEVPVAIYAGARITYFGYTRANQVRRYRRGKPYIYQCLLVNVTANLSHIDAFDVNASGVPYGTPTAVEELYSLQDANWWKVAQEHSRAQMLVLPPEGSFTPRAATLSQFITVADTWGFVMAVDLSMEEFDKAMRASRTSDGVMLAVTGAGQLLASNANLSLHQNGHDVFMDEIGDPLVIAAYDAFQQMPRLNFNRSSASFSFANTDGVQYMCDVFWLNAALSFLVNEEVILLNIISFTGVYQQVRDVLDTALSDTGYSGVWQGVFMGFGGISFGLFWLAFLTIMGWLRWDIVAKKKTLNLVQKMLGESEPVAHRPALIREHPPTMSVKDFCLSLPTAEHPRFTVRPPKMPSIKRMLSQSERCLQRSQAKEVIHLCDLSPEEALAISIYTYEMQEASVALYWFSSPTSRFQIYSEMNAALRTEDPDVIDFWHPLLFPIVSGLKKMQRADLTLKPSPQFTTRVKHWFGEYMCCQPSSEMSPVTSREMDLHIDTHAGALVFRGVSLSARLYQAGHEVVWPGFSSCSSSLEVAKAFCGDKDDTDPSERPERTMFFVEAFTAVRVSALSHFPNEEEMLLLPGTVFKVVHCGCDKFSVFSNAVRFIKLVELQEEPSSVAMGKSDEALDVSAVAISTRTASELRSDSEPLPFSSHQSLPSLATPRSYPSGWYARFKHREWSPD